MEPPGSHEESQVKLRGADLCKRTGAYKHPSVEQGRELNVIKMAFQTGRLVSRVGTVGH